MSIRNTYPTIRPSLNLDFARSRTLDPRITFSRTTTGTYMDSDGLIKVASADEARFDHKYEDGNIVSLGLLVEEDRSNYVRYSEELDNTSVWGRNNVGITTNATISPTGELTADKIIDDTTASAQHWLRIRATGLSTTGTYTASAYMKFDPENNLNERGISLTITDAETGGSSYSAIRVLEGGDYAITADDFTNTTGNVDTLPNGWYRAHLIFTNAGATTELALRLQLTTSSGGVVYTGDGSSGVFAWGAQLEEGSFPTSYIPRPDASTATRNPDNVSMTGNNFSDWYNQDEGTIYVSQKLKSIDTVDRNSAVYLINGGSGNDIFYNVKGGDRNIFVFGDGGTNYSRWQENGDSTDTKTIWAYDVSGDDFKPYWNGIEGVNESTTNTPSATSHTQLEIGATIGAKYNGHISKLSYYPRRLSNSQLQNLTK